MSRKMCYEPRYGVTIERLRSLPKTGPGFFIRADVDRWRTIPGQSWVKSEYKVSQRKGGRFNVFHNHRWLATFYAKADAFAYADAIMGTAA